MGTLQIRLGIYKTIFKKFCPDFVEISSVKVFFSSPPPAGSWVSHGGNEPITNDSRSVSLKPTSAIGALIYLIRASMEDIRKSKKGKNDVR